MVRWSKLRWQLNRRFPRAFFFPLMSPDEFRLFARLTKDARAVIEYGSGGSTVYFLREKKRIHSVDSNPEFHRMMLGIPFVSSRIGNGLTLDFVDVGPTDMFGTPLSNERSSEWTRYVSQPWTRVQPGERVDLVLVDGRFRVACCLYSVRKILELGWSSTVILIHDFSKRKEYHVILPFLQELDSAMTLSAFRVRESPDLAELDRLLEEYTLVPR